MAGKQMTVAQWEESAKTAKEIVILGPPVHVPDDVWLWVSAAFVVLAGGDLDDAMGAIRDTVEDDWSSKGPSSEHLGNWLLAGLDCPVCVRTLKKDFGEDADTLRPLLLTLTGGEG